MKMFIVFVGIMVYVADPRVTDKPIYVIVLDTANKTVGQDIQVLKHESKIQYTTQTAIRTPGKPDERKPRDLKGAENLSFSVDGPRLNGNLIWGSESMVFLKDLLGSDDSAKILPDCIQPNFRDTCLDQRLGVPNRRNAIALVRLEGGIFRPVNWDTDHNSPSPISGDTEVWGVETLLPPMSISTYEKVNPPNAMVFEIPLAPLSANPTLHIKTEGSDESIPLGAERSAACARLAGSTDEDTESECVLVIVSNLVPGAIGAQNAETCPERPFDTHFELGYNLLQERPTLLPIPRIRYCIRSTGGDPPVSKCIPPGTNYP